VAKNLAVGGIQIFSLDIASINLALLEIEKRLNELKGLSGRSQVFDRIRADDPQEASDAVTLGTLP
jgi:hypothetical protein